MQKIKQTFHILSYIQYPFLLIGLYFVIVPLFGRFEYYHLNPELLLEKINTGFIFFGIAISFTTLQDPSKVSLKFEKKIWQNPKWGKASLILTAFLIVLIFSYGLLGFIIKEKIVQEFSFGCIVLGIGLIGYIKFSIEVFNNHRMDKNS